MQCSISSLQKVLGIKTVKPTTNQSICIHKGIITCEAAFETLKIPDLSKTCLMGGLTVPGEREISLTAYTMVPDHLSRREEVDKNVDWEKFI